MSGGKWIVVAVSSIVVIGNAQDTGEGTEVPTVPTSNLYGSQGNVATNRALHEAELNRAAEAARQKKALMSAMAAQSMAAAPRPTSAEAYLAANKPNWPTPPPSSGPDITTASSQAFGDRRERIAPTLPDPSGQPSALVPQFEQEKPGLFDRLRRNSNSSDSAQNSFEPVPASSYEVMASPEPTLVGAEDAVAGDEAMRESVAAPETVEMPGSERSSGFLGKLFGRDRGTGSTSESIPAPAPEPQVDLPPEMAEAPALPEPSADAPIPEPEPFETAAVEPQPAPEPAPPAPVADIFTRRANADMGTTETATVTAEVQADVGGVLVTLYEGTKVGVISRDGGTAKIRLQDQREGTVKASALR